jgi:hypothetical protein
VDKLTKRIVARKAIPEDTQVRVLLNSRRRCCICFGLNRDTSIKQGQISHLDGNPGNNNGDNLAFICFDHHDQYDSKTRQSKNFTQEEVKGFRSELHQAVALAFAGDVAFGAAKIAAADPIAGHYIRGSDFESAELKISRLADGRYHVSGLALWGNTHEYGPNLGELDFIATLLGDTLEYSWSYPDGKQYKAHFRFSTEGLTVSEENWTGIFGLNVNFTGEYSKAT